MTGSPSPEQLGAALFRRVYRKCGQIARAEIVRTFGQFWRGGKADASYLSGRIPFTVLPDNHGTLTVSIPASTDTTTHGDYGTQHVTFPTDRQYPTTTLAAPITGGTTNVLHVQSTAGFMDNQTILLTHGTTEQHTIVSVDRTNKYLYLLATVANSYSISDTVQVLPDVVVSSRDIGWIATWDNRSATGFDLTLSRRVSLTNSEYGTYPSPGPGILPSGSDHVDVVITFNPDFQSPPVVIPNVDSPFCRVTVVNGSVTTHQAILRVSYVPATADGTIGSSTTGIKPSSGAERTDGSGVGSTGPPSADITGDPLTRTDPTWGAESPTTSTVADHTHGENAAASYTQHATTDAAGGHSHIHHHAHDLSNHTHGTPDHSHNLTDPGHTHSFTGAAENAPFDVDFYVHWMASGTRVAPAVTKDASWMAASV